MQISSLFHQYKEQILLLLRNKEMSGKLTRGGVWLAVGGGSEYFFRMIRNIILARLLAPEAFGLMAIVLAFHNFFESFTNVGIKEAIIQNPNGSKDYFLNCAFFLSLARGIILFIVAYLSIPFIASLYGNREMIPMLRLIFTSIIFLSAMSPRAYSNLKNMNYLKWVMVYNGGSLIGITIAIIFGFIYSNVWALVIGFTMESFFRCLLSYIISPFLPRLVFDRESYISLLKFARGILGLPILVFLYDKCDIFVIGKMLNTRDLGLYNLAVTLALVPVSFSQIFLPQLLLPTFSKLQDNKKLLEQTMVKVLRYIVILFLPLYFVMAVFSSEFLSLIYGPQYSEVSMVFKIFCLSAFIRSLGIIIACLFFALGKPNLLRKASFLRLGILLIIIVPLISAFGLLGAALAMLIASLVWIVYCNYIVYSIFHFSLIKKMFISLSD